MLNREQLYEGLSHAAWGYFFMSFDINLGTINILPRFVGFLMILSAIGKLSKERRDLALLRPLCVLLAAWYGADWVLTCFGGDLNGKIPFLDILTTAAELYFHFQLLTDMAALAENYQPEGSGLDRRIRSLRTVYVLLVTAVALPVSLLQVFPLGDWAWVIMALALPAAIAGLFIMASMFRLRSFVRDMPDFE